MIQDVFFQSLTTQCQVSQEDVVLVALSGGADSVALLDLLAVGGFRCQLAHCNFMLRGEESDGDEAFVRQLSRKYGFPLHLKSFDTGKVAALRGVSVEMAARDLRYDWFEKLCLQEKINYIATGHHKDDLIETFFLNLVRGTGIRGLSGMKPCNGKVVRPMLDISRSEIEAYCLERTLEFRTDSSNMETVYVRNKIRHLILPELKEINPSFSQSMVGTMRHLDQARLVLMHRVDEVRRQMVASAGDQLLMSIRLLKELPDLEIMLFEILSPYGFSSKVVKDIINAFEGKPGKQFFSASHRLVKDRTNLILVPRDMREKGIWYIESEEVFVSEPIDMKLSMYDKKEGFEFSRSPALIHLDADLVEFPLTIRHWDKGDVFRPLGMKRFKKVSDFFIDEKYSLVEKEKQLILFSGGDIVWMIGKRVDDRYKITEKTRRVLQIEIA